MNRAARVKLSEETLKIIETGAYQGPRGGQVSIRDAADRALERTILFRDGDFPESPALTRITESTVFEVTGETTVSAASRILGSVDGDDPFILNFASAMNPGGGFLSGSQAQEESLARSSSLYACLMARFDMYAHNRGRSSKLYSDWMIYSPAVPVFRNDDGRLLDRPYLATFLTSPAVNAGAVRQNQPDRVGLIDATNRERARKLLWIANRNGHRVLILGAWGCGVFGNDPATIAAMFDDLLRGEFAGCFERVIMAIYDRTADNGVYKAFAARFPS
ncbi:TIGR02452 family protein [Sphingomonas colocasiae]|uniref:TIGR02452 family protein n=1 Tax=Sphingomonas colocasiae TaxID=1848973 RepID=A0ABS7PLR3_9SPHN|nr:TIGR02452 family protein [Sphingomonas colocasiae]MBY8821009.1 TIGR02452 family protein [Sphingomonas colocasiae]